MAILGVTADASGLTLAAGGPPDPALEAALAALPAGAPVVILVHGYRFDPASPATDPHRTLYAAEALPSGQSWPSDLGLAGRRAGLCIGFGWRATAPHLPALLATGRSGFAQVYERAAAAGTALADLVGRIHRIAPWRRVDVLAHSLGARVALAALALVPRPPSRMILLGAAEFETRALAALSAAPGPGPAVYNVTARANDLYDALFEAFAPRTCRPDRAIGLGLSRPAPNWIDIQIDRAAVADWLESRGLPLGPAAPRFCHWSFCTRPGAFALYRAILGRRPGWDVASLRAEPALAGQEPRWSRILPRRAAAAALPDAVADARRATAGFREPC